MQLPEICACTVNITHIISETEWDQYSTKSFKISIIILSEQKPKEPPKTNHQDRKFGPPVDEPKATFIKVD